MEMREMSQKMQQDATVRQQYVHTGDVLARDPTLPESSSKRFRRLPAVPSAAIIDLG